MSKRQTLIIGLGGVVVTFILLITSLHNINLAVGRPFSWNLLPPPPQATGRETILLPDVPSWFPYVVMALIVMLVIALIISKSLRRDLMRNLPFYIMFMIGAYFIYRGAANPVQQTRSSNDPQAAQPLPTVTIPKAQAPDFVDHPPEWLISIIVLLIILSIATAVVLIVRRLRPRRSEIELIVEEAREALETLRAGGDLRDTITRAYAEMVALLTQKRSQLRDRSLTPREFEQRLAAAGLHDSHIRRLTRLFEMVRYSPHKPGPREEHEAEECLAAIVAAYQTTSGQ